jgi:hypothetical protein
MLRISVFVLVSLLGASVADASPEEDKRKKLLQKLGIDKKKKEQPKPPAEEEPDEEEPDEEEPDEEEPGETPTPPPEGGSSPTEKAAPRVTYSGKIHRLLKSGCASCHKQGGSAGGTKFVLTGGVSADFKAARKFVRNGKPDASALLTKGAGKSHGGGAPFPEGSSKYRALREWIEDGAPRGGGGGGATATPTPVPAPIVAPVPTAPAGKSAKPKPRSAKRSAPAPTPPASPTEVPPTEPAATAAPSAKAPTRPPPIPFAPASHDVLIAKCSTCHAPGQMAAQGGFALTGNADEDYAVTLGVVDTAAPKSSLLLSKATGKDHGGGPTIRADGKEHATLLAWIEDGARGPTAADIPAEPVPGEQASPPVDVVTGASPTAEPGRRLGDGTPLGEQTRAKSPLPFTMPWHLHLNGKLDFSYERREFKGHPFGPGANAFQTYHHFLFLSRAGADDPFGFNVELITQAFYEFNARIAPKRRKFGFLFKAGKILVPFGPEPLFHKTYGGRSGFDQEILPLIWAQPGVAVNAHVRVGPVVFSNDLYTVQGYALRDEAAVLNLQSDVSTIDDFKAAFGDRVGISYGPLTGWYSFNVNRLGFDRLLFMQAVDLEFWRMPDVPFVKNLVLGLGGIRADVSGSGPGSDYYHFGSYGMIGYYPIDFLFLQYRAGLRTTDNRAGLFFDERRADERDRSSHNLSITGRYKGFYATLQLLWSLEKTNEQDDDFLRLTVGYEF